MSAVLPFALAALIPVLIGPLPAESTAITAKLCNGGTITIPLGDGEAPADDGQCHQPGDRREPRRDGAHRGAPLGLREGVVVPEHPVPAVIPVSCGHRPSMSCLGGRTHGSPSAVAASPASGPLP